MTDLKIPVPVTSNNWSPIQRFNPNMPYAEDRFLVWLIGEDISGWFEESWLTDGKFDGPWRHVCDDDGNLNVSVNRLEPVAFKLVEGPNMDDLRHIIEHHGFAA